MNALMHIMPRIPACLFCCLVFSVQAVMAAPSGRHLQGPVQAIVERVIDGDTLAVRARIWLDQEVRVNVRIAHIDTPELAARCAKERERALQARDFIQAMLFADGQAEPMIMLSDIAQDKYGGRVLARVTGAAGRDMAQALMQAGFATAYDGKKRADWCSGFKL